MSAKVETTNRKFVALGVVMLALIMLWSVGRSAPPPNRQQIERDIELKEQDRLARERVAKDEQHVSRYINSVQAAMKNPDSFVLVSAYLMPDGAVCIRYRGTNSFNAVVPGKAVGIGNGFSTLGPDWLKFCEGKRGRLVSGS